MKRLKEINGTNETVALLFGCFVIFVCFKVLTLPSAAGAQTLSGRWNMTLEEGQWRYELYADLRVLETGTARLVILGPTGGDDGLYVGRAEGNRLALAGSGSGGVEEINLAVDNGSLNGTLALASSKWEIRAVRGAPGKSEVPVNKYGMLFNAVWDGVRNYYFDPGMSGIDWNAARATHQPRVIAARNDGELAVAIRRMLRELKMPGAEFFLSSGKPWVSLRGERVSWMELTPGIGYLALRNFSSEDLYSFDGQLDRAMDQLGRYPGLVIDLRGNRGENLEAGLAALNFLLPEGRPVGYFMTREAMVRLKVASIDELDPTRLPVSFVDNPISLRQFQGAGMYLAGGKYKRPYTGKIAVLIDEGCRGSCELAAAAIKEAGIGTLVGHPTAGALVFTVPVSFNFISWNRMVRTDVEGWRMDLPSMVFRTAGKMKLEGSGLQPDILVDPAPSNGDAQLERAIQLLK